MTVVVLASFHGAPGVSTLACALAGRTAAAGRRTLLVEADADGGVLAARLGLRLQPCLTDLAGAARSGIAAEGLWPFGHAVRSLLHVVVAHPSGEQTSAALRASAAHLAAAVSGLDAAVVLDAGRLRPSSPVLPVVESADEVLLVTRPELAPVMNVLHGATWLADRARPKLVLVGSRPYSPRQVTEVTGLPVLGSVPDDRAAVDADPFAASTRKRNAWAGEVAALVARLGLAPEPSTAPETPLESLAAPGPAVPLSVA